jgi:predicted DNA-binding transcriptional regulator YafY
MERHAEIVRQWRILLALESRARGMTLAEAREAAGDGVSERTVRRDLSALAQAGFPIETEKRDGKTAYSLNRDVFGGLATAGFSLSELCALYLSRTMLAALAGDPFQESLTSAFDKLADAMPPVLWRFIDQLPMALSAKGATARPRSASSPRLVDTLMTAILAHRRVRMRYNSFSSRQVKDYVVEPYCVAYAQGTLYLFAFVPIYGEMRTFAVQRIEEAAALEETFDPQTASVGAFPDSLTVYSGQPQRIVIEFTSAEAPYIRERDWHPSQQLQDRADGGVRLTLDVVIDWGLESWVLGFGESARAIAPPSFVSRLAARLDAARRQYDLNDPASDPVAGSHPSATPGMESKAERAK